MFDKFKEALKKLAPEFLSEKEMSDEKIEQDVMNKLDKSVKLDDVDCVTFGLETDDGKIVKVYVNAEQADAFEKALGEKLGEVDDIEECLNDLANEYEIVEVEWPNDDDSESEKTDEDDSEDGSESLDPKVYNNEKEKAAMSKDLKPKFEHLNYGETVTQQILEADQINSLESRLTTATQLMVYNAIIELGIPEVALVRNPYRAKIIASIRAKALELDKTPSLKAALKIFIKRSIDDEKKNAQRDAKNPAQAAAAKRNAPEDDSVVKESLEVDFWDDVQVIIKYVAPDAKAADMILNATKFQQLMKRSGTSAIYRNVTSRLRNRLNVLATAIKEQGDKQVAKDEKMAVTESIKIDELDKLLKDLFILADTTQGRLIDALTSSNLYTRFLTKSRIGLSQKFNGPLRSKLDQVQKALAAAHERLGSLIGRAPAVQDQVVNKTSVKEDVSVPAAVDHQEVKWEFNRAGDVVTISCDKGMTINLDDEEAEKVLKGISNSSIVTVADVETGKKYVFSPRFKTNVIVKAVGGSPCMMTAADVDALMDAISAKAPAASNEDATD